MTPITITINVSQVEAIEAGLDTHGEMKVVVRPSDLDQRQREVLAQVCKSSMSPSPMVPIDSIGALVRLPHFPLRGGEVAVREWLTEAANVVEKSKADLLVSRAKVATEYRAKIEQWLSTPDEPRNPTAFGLSWVEDREPYNYNGVDLADLKHAVAAKVERTRVMALERNSKEKACRKATEEVERTEAAAKVARRTAQLEAALTRAPGLYRRRAAWGLLPDDDLINLLRDQTFAPLGDLLRYVRMTDEDVNETLGLGKVEFITRNADTAEEEEIVLMEQIEAAMPDASVKLREHVGYLAENNAEIDPEVVRRSVRVSIKVGEFDFSREFAARQLGES